jgi:hypothetical protein
MNIFGLEQSSQGTSERGAHFRGKNIKGGALFSGENIWMIGSTFSRGEYFRVEHSSQKRIIGDETLFPGENTVSVGGAVFPVSKVEYLFVEYSFQWRISKVGALVTKGGYRGWKHLEEVVPRKFILYWVFGK